MIKDLKIKKQFRWLSVLVALSIINCQLSTANDSLTYSSYKERAIAELARVEKSNHFVEELTAEDLNELPLGLKKTINNTTVKIAISNAIFYSDHAELTAFAKVEIPQESNALFFGVEGIKLSYNGGIIGDAKLVLLGDIPIRIGRNTTLTLKGGFNIETGQAIDLTYISMDCKGFKELGLSADLSFSRSMLVPVDVNGNRLEGDNNKVHSSFQTVVSDWNDILVNVSLPRFEITPLKGLGFNIEQAVLDMSDLRNSPDVIYPRDYEFKYVDATNPSLWKGLYIKQFDVILPKQFANRKDQNRRISFSASNMIIDNNGLSGMFAAKNLLSIEQGNASGWRFSVDEFHINLEANTLTGAGFSGAMGLPIANKEQTLGYTACISPNNEYLIRVNTLNKLNFNLWKAEATLDENSYIQLAVINNQFKPEACLNGKISINASNRADNSKPIASFKGLDFRGLRLKTDAPYVRVDYFGYNGTLAVAGFPVSIDNITLTANNSQAVLGFGVNINLMSEKFGGRTRINIVGDFKNEEGVHSWAFQKVKLNAIQIKADFGPAFSMDGSIDMMENNPIYGDAIGGNVKAKFLNKIEVSASAIFGNTTGTGSYRYWFVDARANLPAGMMLLPPFNISGLGGGAYYHMRKAGNDMLSAGNFPAYTPDINTGLGIRAAVMFNAAREEVIDGEASLEASFNSNGGINYIGFFGYAKFLGKLPFVKDVNRLTENFNKINDNLNNMARNYPGAIAQLESLKQYNPTQAAQKILPLPSSTQSGLSAAVGIQYDFTQKVFHANFDVYVNAAGGLITGVGSNYRAGWAALHIAPKEWYLHLGTPTDRLGLRIGVGGFSVSTGSYLMVGDRIPGSPPPPREVADILGLQVQQLDYMRDLNALGDGRGFAFGSSLSINTGDITFLILYANFKAGVGFDIMLKDYGNAHCAGSSSRIGINGWYANGQAYAYLQGELGVKVRLWFIKARIPIISGGAAALFQAKLPNPSWFVGYLGVNCRILRGLIKINLRFKISFGNECTIVSDNSSPVNTNVIADLTPKDKSNGVEVFTAPQASFNMEVNKPFEVQDENSGVKKTYRIKLEQFNVSNNNQPVTGRIEWNDDKDVATFYSTEILTPNQSFKATVSVSFEELRGNSWQTVYENGKKSIETREVSFTTGTAPNNIPLKNIEYAYPVVDQKNYYPAESNKGFIKLRQGQSYLFESGKKYEMSFVSGNNIVTTQNISYDKGAARINFDLPRLANRSTYTVDMYSIGNKADSTDESKDYQQTDVGEDGSYAVKNKQAAEIQQRGDIANSVLNYAFNSSRYNLLADKINNIKVTQSLVTKISMDVINLQSEANQDEVFDIAEITGSDYTKKQPLIQPVATLKDEYFMQYVGPRYYTLYPLFGLTLTNRDSTLLGLPPDRALPLINAYVTELQNNNVNGLVKTRLPYIYNVTQVYKQDYSDLQTQFISKRLKYWSSWDPNYQYTNYLYYFTTYNFPFMLQGRYGMRYQYVLPDGTKGSSGVIEYENPIK